MIPRGSIEPVIEYEWDPAIHEIVSANIPKLVVVVHSNARTPVPVRGRLSEDDRSTGLHDG